MHIHSCLPTYISNSLYKSVVLSVFKTNGVKRQSLEKAIRMGLLVPQIQEVRVATFPNEDTWCKVVKKLAVSALIVLNSTN